jgi:hypothetical protein
MLISERNVTLRGRRLSIPVVYAVEDVAHSLKKRLNSEISRSRASVEWHTTTLKLALCVLLWPVTAYWMLYPFSRLSSLLRL